MKYVCRQSIGLLFLFITLLMMTGPVIVKAYSPRKPPEPYMVTIYPDETCSYTPYGDYDWSSGKLSEIYYYWGNLAYRAFLRVWFTSIPSEAFDIEFRVYYGGGTTEECELRYLNEDLDKIVLDSFNFQGSNGWYSYGVDDIRKDSGIKIEFEDTLHPLDFIHDEWTFKNLKITYWVY